MDPVGSETESSADEARAGTRWLLVAFAALTLLAVSQLLVLADVTDRYWAWSIRTELTAAFLGAAYAAGFVLSISAMRHRRWSQIRVPIVTVTVFTLLTCVATVIHAHRLHLVSGGPVARAAAWIWLAVYLVIPLACLVVVARQQRRRGRPGAILRPMPGWLTGLLAAEGAVLFIAGVVLFAGGMTVHHQEPRSVTGFWPWALTPLSAQVIGAWLLALGVAVVLAIWDGDLSRLAVSAVTYATFGVLQLVVVFWYRAQVDVRYSWLWIYVLVLAAIALTGGYGWWAARAGPSDQQCRARGTEETRQGTPGAHGRSGVAG